MPTDAEVGAWMAEQVEEHGELYQSDAVDEIEARFGDDFIYENKNGNPAISKSVLKEFGERTPDVVWEAGGRYWRKRESSDPSGNAERTNGGHAGSATCLPTG